MTTLPPEDQEPQVPVSPQMPEVTEPDLQSQLPPQTPPVPPAPPAAPQFEQPAAPQATPAAPQYQQPQQPTPPQYQQPFQQQPGGGQVPPGGYQQQYAQQPVGDPAGTITLNYWLSVFFTWIPALIFFLVEKDKGNRLANDYHRENLNFALLRTGVVVATYILAMIPYIGWLFALVLWIGSVVLFVFHIMAAAKATDAFRRGAQPPFNFNIPLIK